MLFALLVLTVSAGLVSRSDRASFLPEFITLYAGDVLWASAIYIMLALARPSAQPLELLLGTLLLAAFVEVSQLYQAEWINRLRHTFPLGLILGYGFRWSDMLCYLAGGLTAFSVDMIQAERKRF